jgi:hypothetical protein
MDLFLKNDKTNVQYHRKFKILISLVDKKKRWQYNSVCIVPAYR